MSLHKSLGGLGFKLHKMNAFNSEGYFLFSKRYRNFKLLLKIVKGESPVWTAIGKRGYVCWRGTTDQVLNRLPEELQDIVIWHAAELAGRKDFA